MICSIRDYSEYGFTGDTSYIKEFIYDYNNFSLVEILELTKEDDKQYVFTYSGELTKEILLEMNSLGSVRDNIYIGLEKYGGSETLLTGIKYFFISRAMCADSLDKLVWLIDQGVSQVYIIGELGFRLSDVKTVIKNSGKEVKIRVSPNRCEISGLINPSQGSLENITSFWIRPNDLILYEDFIDIVEFSCLDKNQSVYYDIYFQDKNWGGDLSEIIMQLPEGVIDNRGLISNFTLYRMDCGKKCLLDKCHHCYKLATCSKLIVDNSLETETKESI